VGNAVSQIINNAITTLASVMDNSQTTVVVATAAPFPLEGDFYILIGTESMLVTAVAGTSLTVARAVGGTSAAEHGAGALVKAVTSKESLGDFFRAQWIRNEQMSITKPVTQIRATVSDFTWVNQGAATATDREGKIVLKVPSDGAGDQLRGMVILSPTAPYNVVQAISLHAETGGAGTGMTPFPQGVLMFRESGTSKLFTLGVLPRSDGHTVQVKTMTNETTELASKVHIPWQFGKGPIWLKIEDTNTDLKFYVGPNGIDWIQIYSEGRTTHMAGGPDQVGFGFNQNGVNNNEAFIELLQFGLGA